MDNTPEEPCYFPGMGSPHDAHARADGQGWRPGYSEPDEPDPEPGAPPSIAEQVRALERTIERVREAVSTDRPAAMEHDHRDRELQALRSKVEELRQHIGAMRKVVRETFGLPDDEAIDVIGAARNQLDEARQWARHGYEIGQRHCGWTDHGVAPDWLTEGWDSAYFDTCEHLARASEYDAALSRVRSLPEQPEVADANNPYSANYLRGYRTATERAKHATLPPEPAKGGKGR